MPHSYTKSLLKTTTSSSLTTPAIDLDLDYHRMSIHFTNNYNSLLLLIQFLTFNNDFLTLNLISNSNLNSNALPLTSILMHYI